MSRSFVHLHVHTLYSLLDGAIRVGPLVDRAAELGMPAVAMTDHGNMFGAVDFYKTCKSKGVKPIIGTELNTTPHLSDSVGRSFHLTALARSAVGYKNLLKLSSFSYLEGKRGGQPHADREMLHRYRKDVIALSGDLGGELAYAILHDREDEARELAALYRELFEPGHFFLELMDNHFPEQKRVNAALIKIGRALSIPLVATNDCHYLDQEEAAAHAILMCIQLGKTVDLEVATSHGFNDFYFKTAEQMWAAFSEVPEACENTLKIAEMIDIEVALGEVYLPQYRVPEVFLEEHAIEDSQDGIHRYFADRSEFGLEQRFAHMRAKNIPFDEEEYRARLGVEIAIIQQMDFPGYFLIVWDFINWSKAQSIPVGPGRGSGAGSLVAYSLGITDIDPIPYGLLFERFLNPERVSMPDFDIDFCMHRRGEVIDYVMQKYGKDNVAQIVTYGSLKARACIKDVGRALNFSYGETDRIAKMVPDELGISLKAAREKEPKLAQLIEQDPRVGALYGIAQQLEGLFRQTGMHAAGVVISEKPLWEYVPIFRGVNDEIISQYAKNEVEEAGLVKFDFLGLKTLTVIDGAVRLVDNTHRAQGRPPFELSAIPMNDPGVFKMISKGATTGVFQLESSGFQEMLVKLKPTCFEDIIAAVALYRPGPMGSGMHTDFIDRKHGRAAVEYPHPWLEEILRETYGVIVYQEQVMQIAQRLAGFSLGGADIMRRAMGKKKASEMAKQRKIFVDGAEDLGVDPEKASEIFSIIEFFAGYGFNKCVVGDTVIVDASTGERTTVEALFKAPRDFQIHALNEADWSLRARPVTDVVWNGYREVFELRTEQGKRITTTDNHPFFTERGWVELKDLRPGDLIAAAPGVMSVESEPCGSEHEPVWDRVVSIEPRDHQHTFDLTVEDDHNFVANGLIVHNSHSAAYALITYQTAYLKTHYPVEFYAALMSCDRENTTKVVRTIHDARKNNVQVMPPDLSASDLDFSVDAGKIRFGLGAIKGLGDSAIDAILEARREQAFDSFFDFFDRVDLRRVNKRVLEALVKSGAFDSAYPTPLQNVREIGAARAAMFGSIQKALERGQRNQADRAAGQMSLFSMFAAVTPETETNPLQDFAECEAWTDQALLSFEKDTLGFYVTGHPLDRYALELQRYSTCDTSSLERIGHREVVTIGGVVTAMRERPLKSGKGRMAFFTLEDRVGEVEILCFSTAFAEYEDVIKSDQPLLVRGRLQVEGDESQKIFRIRAEEVQLLIAVRQRLVKHVLIHINASESEEQTIRDIEALLRRFPGDCKAYLRITYPALGQATLTLPAEYNVMPSDDFLMAVERLLGDEKVKLH